MHSELGFTFGCPSPAPSFGSGKPSRMNRASPRRMNRAAADGRVGSLYIPVQAIRVTPLLFLLETFPDRTTCKQVRCKQVRYLESRKTMKR
jgi:hypothetical protein